MANVGKTAVDAAIRANVFSTLGITAIGEFTKVNDRQYGIIVTDLNGNKRYARVGVIVAEEREDFTAEEIMAAEIAEYNAKQAKKAEAAAKKAEKIARDQARREAKKAEAEAEAE